MSDSLGVQSWFFAEFKLFNCNMLLVDVINLDKEHINNGNQNPVINVCLTARTFSLQIGHFLNLSFDFA